MVFVCEDLGELKLVVRCTLAATKIALTVEELLLRVIYAFGGGPNCIQPSVFGYTSFDELLKSMPEVVQLEDPADKNSLVNLVSSELSKHMEDLVMTNVPKPPSDNKQKFTRGNLLVPYRVQCAFIRIFLELYPDGLQISDFVSKILSMPIFKSLADLVDQLLYDLSHIFTKIGMEMIAIQPTLCDKVKKIKENGKFCAMDINKINVFSLVESDYDEEIAKGIEYPLFDILEESIKSNIELLLDENPSGIFEREICDLYIQKFGSSFSHFRRWGFSRVSQMFTNLPKLCCVHFLGGDIKIISIKNHICDVYQKTNVIEKVYDYENFIFENDGTKNGLNTNGGALNKVMENNANSSKLLSGCCLNREIQQIELEVNISLNVIISGVSSDILPSIMCQIIDESSEINDLLQNMKSFYLINEDKFKFDFNDIMIKHTYAFYLDDMWLRGTVVDVQDAFDEIKIKNIDTGFIHTISFENIRLLHLKFSHLQAQAFTCFLYGIESMDDSELVKIVGEKCTIHVVSVEHHCKTVFVKVKLFDSTSTDYLNDEWIKNGCAEPDDSE